MNPRMEKKDKVRCKVTLHATSKKQKRKKNKRGGIKKGEEEIGAKEGWIVEDE